MYMTFEPSRWRPFSVNELYPTPMNRIENPIPTVFEKGDLVIILIGPATGKIGQVVVERNANYVDKEPYSADDDIAVQVVELMQLAPSLRDIIIASDLVIDSGEVFTEAAIRWFDTPDQLELVLRPVVTADTNDSPSS